jgi:hypothetical protein
VNQKLQPSKFPTKAEQPETENPAPPENPTATTEKVKKNIHAVTDFFKVGKKLKSKLKTTNSQFS